MAAGQNPGHPRIPGSKRVIRSFDIYGAGALWLGRVQHPAPSGGACGALPIGWNREREERSAGLRTFPLVAIATCGFIRAAEALTSESPEATARIVEGLITGMGFIGGGAILRLKDSVKGTATAASLWVTGAVGVSAGLGAFDVALVLSVVTLATLWALSPLKRTVTAQERGSERDEVGVDGHGPPAPPGLIIPALV